MVERLPLLVVAITFVIIGVTIIIVHVALIITNAFIFMILLLRINTDIRGIESNVIHTIQQTLENNGS